MSFIKDEIRRRFFSDEGPGARVVGSGALSIEVTKSPQEHELVVFRDYELLSVSMRLQGESSTVDVKCAGAEAWSHAPGTEAAAQRLYSDIKRRLGRGRAPRRYARIAIAAALVLAVAYVGTRPAPVAGEIAQIAPPPATGPVVPQAAGQASASPQTVPQQAWITAGERSLITSLPGKVKLGGTGPVYYVFTDPNCPYCKQFEQSIGAVADFTAFVLPLGYKTGSRDQAAAVLCAANPAKEWANLIAGGSTTSKPCDKGYAQVDQNMRAFEALRLNSTPTTITPKGVVMTGAASATELAAALLAQ